MTDQTPKMGEDPLAELSAEELIGEFGGIRPMAAKLGIPVTTVQGWKSRGRIPLNRRQAILEAARNHNIDLSPGAERSTAKKPVTISSVPMLVEITDSEESQQEAASSPTNDGPDAAPPSETSAEAVSGSTSEMSSAPAAETKPSPGPESKPASTRTGRPASSSSSSEKSSSSTKPSPGPASPPSSRSWRGGVFVLAVLAAAGYGAWLAFPDWFAGPADSGKPKPSAAGKEPSPKPVGKSPTATGSLKKEPLRAAKVAPKPLPVPVPKPAPKPVFEPAVASPPKSPSPPPGVSEQAARQMIGDKTAGLGRRLSELSVRAGKLDESDKMLAQKTGKELALLHAQIAGVREDLAKLSNKLAALKQPRPIQGEQIALQALLLGQLESEVAAGRPYAGPLERLRKSLPGAEVKGALDGLAARAERGIPTRLDLTKRFAVLARKITLEPQVITPEPTADGFVGWLAAKLKGLVSVRRVDGPGPVPPLSKAEAALADGDFVRAVAYLEKSVPPSTARWVAPWVADARAHEAAQDHLAKLRWYVSGLLRKKAAAK